MTNERLKSCKGYIEYLIENFCTDCPNSHNNCDDCPYEESNITKETISVIDNVEKENEEMRKELDDFKGMKMNNEHYLSKNHIYYLIHNGFHLNLDQLEVVDKWYDAFDKLEQLQKENKNLYDEIYYLKSLISTKDETIKALEQAVDGTEND